MLYRKHVKLQRSVTIKKDAYNLAMKINKHAPGMILLPGSFSGRSNSPSPLRGPEPRKRMSFAIFIKLAAATLSEPLISTRASLAARASNLFGAETNGIPVYSFNLLATFSAKPMRAFNPVPTAVPP